MACKGFVGDETGLDLDVFCKRGFADGSERGSEGSRTPEKSVS